MQFYGKRFAEDFEKELERLRFLMLSFCKYDCKPFGP